MAESELVVNIFGCNVTEKGWVVNTILDTL